MYFIKNYILRYRFTVKRDYKRNLTDLPPDEWFALILSCLCKDIYHYYRGYINPASTKIYKVSVTKLSSPGFVQMNFSFIQMPVSVICKSVVKESDISFTTQVYKLGVYFVKFAIQIVILMDNE